MSKLLKSKIIWKWTSILILLMCFVAAGCSHRGRSHWSHGTSVDHIDRMEEQIEELLDDIEATQEQRQSISATLDPLLERAQDFKGTRKSIRNAYQTEWSSSIMDPVKVNGLLDAELEKLGPFLHDLTDAITAVHTVLTPNQREIVAKHIGQHSKR